MAAQFQEDERRHHADESKSCIRPVFMFDRAYESVACLNTKDIVIRDG